MLDNSFIIAAFCFSHQVSVFELYAAFASGLNPATPLTCVGCATSCLLFIHISCSILYILPSSCFACSNASLFGSISFNCVFGDMPRFLAIPFAYATGLLLSEAGAYLLMYCRRDIVGEYTLLLPACIFSIFDTRALNHSCGVANRVNLSPATFCPQNQVSIMLPGLKFLTAGVLPYCEMIACLSTHIATSADCAACSAVCHCAIAALINSFL